MKGLEFNVCTWDFGMVLFFSAVASDSVQLGFFDDHIILTTVK